MFLVEGADLELNGSGMVCDGTTSNWPSRWLHGQWWRTFRALNDLVLGAASVKAKSSLAPVLFKSTELSLTDLHGLYAFLQQVICLAILEAVWDGWRWANLVCPGCLSKKAPLIWRSKMVFMFYVLILVTLFFCLSAQGITSLLVYDLNVWGSTADLCNWNPGNQNASDTPILAWLSADICCIVTCS